MIANKKKAFIWWAYFFYLLFLWLWFMIFHDRMKNWEVLTYLTYSNNNRKQKNTFIWWMYFSCWWLLWLCFIIFHDRSKNEEVLAYLTYSNNDRKQIKHFHLMSVFFLSAIVTAVLHHIPWQNEKLRSVNISYLQQ